MDRVRAAAEQRGISMADFVIMVVNERFHGIDAGASASTHKPAGGKRRAADGKKRRAK